MVTILRDATPLDEKRWRELWADYIAFYNVNVPQDITDSVWNRVFDPQSRLFMRVAEVDGRMEGFALCHTHEGTWVKNDVLYLEDLFLSQALRGKGIGKALMDDLVALGKEKGWSRLYWHTHKDNAKARKLYDQYAEWDDHIRYRVTL